MPEDKNYDAFLEMVSRGEVSNSIVEWPQAFPACKYAIEKIKRLEQTIKTLRLITNDLYDINSELYTQLDLLNLRLNKVSNTLAGK